MGTWGYEPFENDGAADMIAGLFDPVRKMLRTRDVRERRAHYGEARGAIELAIRAAGTDILGGPNLKHAVQALDSILADKEWIEDAHEPNDLAAALVRQKRRVERAIARAARKRRHMILALSNRPRKLTRAEKARQLKERLRKAQALRPPRTPEVLEQALTRLQKASPAYVNALSVKAGVYTKKGKLTRAFGGTGK